MKQADKFLLHKIIVLGLIGLIGCAPKTIKPVKSVLYIPPGLDSATVIRANQIANDNFVSVEQEHKAEKLTKTGKANLAKVDEFWAYLEKRVHTDKPLTKAEQDQFAREFSQGEKSLAQWKELTKSKNDDKLAQQAKFYCLQAQQHLENAVRINPFDKNARVLLSIAYYNLQHIFGLQKNYEKAVDILERLTRLEKGEHDLFRLLAENYLALKHYDKALENFKKAMSVLVKTSFESPPDTSKLFYYAYTQGDLLARLYDAVNATKAFQAAKTFARTEQEKADVNNYLEWINWDGGNIKASEMWDEIIALEASQNYQQMATACNKLLAILKTNQAKLSVNHKLAVIEFEFLNHKAKAVERMRQMYSIFSQSETKLSPTEIQPFLNTYGAMLYRLGIEAREKQEKKLALAYFTKATSFEWDQVAKVYIELITLLWNDPEQAIYFGKQALKKSNELSTKESSDLLSLMVRAHKSAGRFDEARSYYDKWKQLRSVADEKQN